MDDDTGRTLSEIHDTSFSRLEKQLLEIQKYTLSRSKAEAWAERLRFLDISGVSSEDEEPRRKRRRVAGPDETRRLGNHHAKVIPLTRRLSTNGRSPYVAISWRWNGDELPGQDGPTSRYLIRGAKEQPHVSEVPDVYFDRAIRFARAKDIKFLWIDKECIYQKDEEDQSTGIQAMDLVYRDSELSLGLLNKIVHSQEQLDGLNDLLSHKVFEAYAEKPRLRDWVSRKRVSRIFDVLRFIISDERWSRTWIFQEDHCASHNMELMIPYALSLRKNKKLFGDLQGELLISCAKLRKATTSLSIACNAASYEFPDDLLSRVKQYNIWNQGYGRGSSPRLDDGQLSNIAKKGDEMPYLLASSLSILDDIRTRQYYVVADRLAIFANCCQYSTRLDSVQLTSAGYGLSTCYLCLYLLNGEILRNGIGDRSSQTSQDPKELWNCSIYELLNRFSMTFNPPREKFRLSFVDSFCRFGEVKLTPEGTETAGWLWEIDEAIVLTNRERAKIKSHYAEQEISSSDFLGRVLEGLEQHTLSSRLMKHGATVDSSNDQELYTFFIQTMIDEVIDALMQDKALRFARLHGKSDVLAIFVGTSNDIRQTEPTMVFTGFWKEKEKYVSIVVEHDGTCINGRRRLYARSWINGLWFSNGNPKENYVFPWPFTSSSAEDGS